VAVFSIASMADSCSEGATKSALCRKGASRPILDAVILPRFSNARRETFAGGQNGVRGKKARYLQELASRK
jgi:hypothetical protein